MDIFHFITIICSVIAIVFMMMISYKKGSGSLRRVYIELFKVFRYESDHYATKVDVEGEEVTKDKVLEDHAQRFGFRYEKLVREEILNADGTIISRLEASVLALTENVAVRDHFIEAICGNQINNINFEFSASRTDGGSVNGKIFVPGKNCIRIQVIFSPALASGASAQYTISLKSKSWPYYEWIEDIVDAFNKGVYERGELFETFGFVPRYPIDKLVLRVTFPKGYQVSGSEFYDVFVGQSFQRDQSAYFEFRSISEFSIQTIGDIYLHELKIEKPRLSANYVLRWVPPSCDSLLATIKKIR